MDQQVKHPKYNRQFFEDSFKLIVKYLENTLKGEQKVVDFKLPEELKKLVDTTIGDEPTSSKDLLANIETICKYSVKPHHPHFHNSLFGGFDEYAVSGAMIGPVINGSMYTYEMAPVFTLMENEIYEHFRKIMNWDKVDGIMCPGGSFGNILAIQAARFHCFPEVKEKGIQGLPPLKIMVNQVGHYSIKKGVNLCGMGTDSLSFVKTDNCARIIPADLDKKIQEEMDKGNKVIMIVATIGTTVEGAIDNVEEITKIAQKYKIWLHLDAAYGGVFLASPQLQAKKLGNWKGADSVVWDPHKGLLVPLQSTLFMSKHPGLQDKSNSTAADYLFHKERSYYDNCLDTGNKSLQCGRINDVFKTWVYFKGNGWKGIDAQVKRLDHLTQYLKNYLVSKPERWELAVPEAQTFNICFWYLPKRLNRAELGEEAFFKATSDIIVLSKKFMMEESKIMMGYSKSKGIGYFWRIVLFNPYNTEEDMIYYCDLLERYCEQAYDEIYGTQQEKK